jgi:hypothetical protein
MQRPPKIQRMTHEGTSVLEVERDPRLRCQIWTVNMGPGLEL